MFVWMVGPALAGELEETVRTDEGVSETLRVDPAVMCQRSTYDRCSDAARRTVTAEGRPGTDPKEWRFFLHVEGRSFRDGDAHQE